MTQVRRILSPTDFSEGSEHALAYALQLAEKLGAEVQALHAYQLPIYVLPEGALDPGTIPAEEVTKAARERMNTFGESHPKVKEVHLREGPAARCIVDVAKEIGADMIVMGTHGRTGLTRMLVGSVAERVVRSSPVPVLTVPPRG
jgi:nucleotide-binding universal stress UspA family protein